MEEYKLRCLPLVLDEIHRSLEEFAVFVKDREPRLRECYADKIDLTSSEFVKMMMVDSAFVYGMLLGVCCGPDGSRIISTPFQGMEVITEDLMLLENQIPLFILEDLDNQYRSAQQPKSPNSKPEKASFIELVCKFVNERPDIGASSFDIVRVSSEGPVHLLDCLRICHLSPVTNRGRHCQPRSQPVQPREEGESSRFGITVPTITELHHSGVKFVRNNESTHLLDIKFDCQQGILKIPEFFMGDSTVTIFRNLLAFEQCRYFLSQALVDYFVLLDELISQPRDVDLLVVSGVLKNTLGDSTQAASIINNMTQGVRIGRASFFSDVRQALAEYYKVPAHKWTAMLRQRYFNNPWAGISVFAAAILLVLTIIQTVYAVISK